MVDRIGQLYAIEAEAKRASPEERLARLAALRAKQSKPVLDEIRTWLPRGPEDPAGHQFRRAGATRPSPSGGRITTGAVRSEGPAWRRSSTRSSSPRSSRASSPGLTSARRPVGRSGTRAPSRSHATSSSWNYPDVDGRSPAVRGWRRLTPVCPIPRWSVRKYLTYPGVRSHFDWEVDRRDAPRTESAKRVPPVLARDGEDMLQELGEAVHCPRRRRGAPADEGQG